MNLFVDWAITFLISLVAIGRPFDLQEKLNATRERHFIEQLRLESALAIRDNRLDDSMRDLRRAREFQATRHEVLFDETDQRRLQALEHLQQARYPACIAVSSLGRNVEDDIITAIAFARSRDYNAALNRVELLTSKPSIGCAAYLLHGDLLIARQPSRFEDAVRSYRRAAEVAMANPIPSVRLVGALSALGRLEEASAEADKAIFRFPDRADPLAARAEINAVRLARHARSPSEEIRLRRNIDEDLQAADTRMSDNRPEFMFRRAVMLTNLGNDYVCKASSAWRQVVAIPDTPDSYRVAAATFWAKRRDWREVATWLDNFRDLANADCLGLQARAHHHLGNSEECLKCLRKLSGIGPLTSEQRRWRALALIRVGAYIEGAILVAIEEWIWRSRVERNR